MSHAARGPGQRPGIDGRVNRSGRPTRGGRDSQAVMEA